MNLINFNIKESYINIIMNKIRKKKNDSNNLKKTHKELFIETIPQNNLWTPNHDLQLYKHNTNSWYDWYESNPKILIPRFTSKVVFYPIETKKSEKLYRSKEVVLELNKQQKKIMNRWFISFGRMYNEALWYIKHKKVYKFEDVRNALKPFSHEVCERSGINTDKRRKRINKSGNIRVKKMNKYQNNIKIHDLDLAVKLACDNYDSTWKNFKAGNIKHFKMKYWKYNKLIKTFYLEKNGFSQGTMLKKTLGQVKAFYNNELFDLNTVKCDSLIQYNDYTKRYILFVSEVIGKIPTAPSNQLISLDPGIRTFMTGLSEKKIVKIGSNCSDKIRYYLRHIDKLHKYKLSEQKRKRLELKYNNKINNYVNELHWKTINNLTKNYGTIIIGDMSCQGIVSNKHSKLSRMTKRIVYKLKFFQFRQRLEYKCNIRMVNYKCVNESYTSKVCSICGNVKEDLGSNKVYNCLKCNKKLCRDTNGARNIYVKALL